MENKRPKINSNRQNSKNLGQGQILLDQMKQIKFSDVEKNDLRVLDKNIHKQMESIKKKSLQLCNLIIYERKYIVLNS